MNKMNLIKKTRRFVSVIWTEKFVAKSLLTGQVLTNWNCFEPNHASTEVRSKEWLAKRKILQNVGVKLIAAGEWVSVGSLKDMSPQDSGTEVWKKK